MGTVARFLQIIAAVTIFSTPLAASFSTPLAASSHINLTVTATAALAALPARLPARRGRRYLRKRQVAARYGVDERTVDRMTRDGRLPPYIYLPGSRLPLQDEEELDRRDDAAAAARSFNKSATAETAA